MDLSDPPGAGLRALPPSPPPPHASFEPGREEEKFAGAAAAAAGSGVAPPLRPIVGSMPPKTAAHTRRDGALAFQWASRTRASIAGGRRVADHLGSPIFFLLLTLLLTRPPRLGTL